MPCPPVLPHAVLQEVLGYLNFSSGGIATPSCLRNINGLYSLLEAGEQRGNKAPMSCWPRPSASTWGRCTAAGGAFADAEQAQAVLEPGRSTAVLASIPHGIIAMCCFIRPTAICRAVFSGPACSRRCSARAAVGRDDRIVRGDHRAAERLSRPPAGGRAAKPSRRSSRTRTNGCGRCRCIIAGAGVGGGRYATLIEQRWRCFARPTPSCLRAAWFDPALLGRVGLRSAGVRFRPSGEQAAELPLRPMGPAPHRSTRAITAGSSLQQVTLDALLRARERAERHSGRGEAVRSGRGAGRQAILMASGQHERPRRPAARRRR